MDCNLRSSRKSEDPRIRSHVNILDYNLLSKSAIAADPRVYCGRQSARARICSARRIFDGDVARKRRRTLSCLIRARIGEERANEGSLLSLREIVFLLKPS